MMNNYDVTDLRQTEICRNGSSERIYVYVILSEKKFLVDYSGQEMYLKADTTRAGRKKNEKLSLRSKYIFISGDSAEYFVTDYCRRHRGWNIEYRERNIGGYEKLWDAAD